MKKLGMILVVMMLLSIILSACSVIQGMFGPSIVGDWANDEAGTIHFYSRSEFEYYDRSGTTKIEKDADKNLTLVLSEDDVQTEFPMKLDGDTLTLTMYGCDYLFDRTDEQEDIPVVAQVGYQVITQDAFIARVKYERYQLVNTFTSYASSAYASYFHGQLTQIQDQLDDYEQFGSDTLDKMIDELVLVQKAQSMGIMVNDDEVETEIQHNLDYYPDGDAPEETTPISEKEYQKSYTTVMANIEDNADFSESNLREYIRTVLFQRKVYNRIEADIDDTQEMIWARHILVEEESMAEDVLAKLKAGGDWIQLTLDYSIDTANNTTGGDLGWFIKGTMVPEFEDAAWALDINEISEPVKTQFGWHIIQLLGREQRELTADQISDAASAAYEQFIDDAKEEISYTKFDDWNDRVPKMPEIPEYYRISG